MAQLPHRRVGSIELSRHVIFVDALIMRWEMIAGLAERTRPDFGMEVDRCIGIEHRSTLFAWNRFIWQNLNRNHARGKRAAKNRDLHRFDSQASSLASCSVSRMQRKG